MHVSEEDSTHAALCSMLRDQIHLSRGLGRKGHRRGEGGRQMARSQREERLGGKWRNGGRGQRKRQGKERRQEEA